METHNYRNRLDQLQEKIRKSELERKKLEQKFENLMRDRNDSGRAAIKDLRTKYNHFLDDDRKRTERNDNLLRTLERVDYQAGTLAAKSERLKMLKGQYELYLMRRWSPRRSILMTPNTPLKESSVSTQTNIDENLMPPSTVVTMGDRVDANYKDFKSDFVKYLSRVNRLSSTTPLPTMITNLNTYAPTNDYKSDVFDRNGNYNIKQTRQYDDMYHMDDQFNTPLGLSQSTTIPINTTDGNLRDNDAQLHQPLANTNSRQLERGAQLNTPYNPISTESYFSSTYSPARPSNLMGNKQWMERPQISTIKTNNIDKPMHTNEQIINSKFTAPCTTSPNIVISTPTVYKDNDYQMIANNHNQPRVGNTNQPLQIDTNTINAAKDSNTNSFVDAKNKFSDGLIRKYPEINPVYGLETNIHNIDVDVPQKVGAPYDRPHYSVVEPKQNLTQPTTNINTNADSTSLSPNSKNLEISPSYAVITNVHNIDVNVPQQAADFNRQQYKVLQTQENIPPPNNDSYTKSNLPVYQPSAEIQQKILITNVNQNEINNPDVIQVPYSTPVLPVGDKKIVPEPRILNSNHMVENIHQIWEKVVEVSPSISPPTPPDEKQIESIYKEQRTSQIAEKDEDFNNGETVESSARASIVQSDIDKNVVNYSPYNDTHNAHQHKIVPYPKNLDEVQYEVIIQNNLIKKNSTDIQYANHIINNDNNELTPVENNIVALDNNKVNFDAPEPSANIEKIEEVYYGEKIFYPTDDAAANAAKHIDISRQNTIDKVNGGGGNSALNENLMNDKQWQQQQEQTNDARNASISRTELMLDNNSDAYKQDSNAGHGTGNQGNVYYNDNQSIVKNNEQISNENKLREIKETNLIKITQKEVKQVEYVSEKYKPDEKVEQPQGENNLREISKDYSNENYKGVEDKKENIEIGHGNVDAVESMSENYDETKLYDQQQYNANQEEPLNVIQEPLKDYSQEYGIENIQQEYAEVEPTIQNQTEQNYSNQQYQDNQNYYDQDYQGTQIYDNQDGQVYPGNVEDFAQGELSYQQPEYQEYQQEQGEPVYTEQTNYTEQPLEAMQQSDQQNPNYAEYYQPGDQTQMYEQNQYTNHAADNQQQEYVQYSNDAYYTQEPGENYYNDVQPQQQDQEFHQTAQSENSDLKSDVDNSHPHHVSEITNNVVSAQAIANNLLQPSGEDSSTYSDNTINVPQQLVSGFDTSDGLPAIPAANRPTKTNPQESESDEKSLPVVGAITIAKNSINDESDFDFSSSK